MLRKVFFGWFLCVGLTGNAMAQVNAVDLEVSGAFASKYIWNGFDRIRGQGLDDGPVLQPKLTVGLGHTPLHVGVGGSFVMNNDSQLHEMTYHVYVQRFATPFTRVGLGYTYYDDRVAPLLDTLDHDVHELWGAMLTRNVSGVHNGLAAKYEISARDAFDSFFCANAEFGYSYPLVPSTPGGFGLDLDGTTRILYNTQVKTQGVELVQSGFSAWQAGLTAEFRAAHVRVTPFLTYQVSLEESVNDEDPLWAGITVLYAY